jgi:quercetin dioxygenase-like cupin family protein
MQWAGVAERGSQKIAMAFLEPGDGQPEHTHAEAQMLWLSEGALRVWRPGLLEGAVDWRAPVMFRFDPGERHGWEAKEPSVVFSLWEKP